MTLEKQSVNCNRVNRALKSNAFQLSLKVKNIHQGKLHQQHPHWRKRFLAASTFEGL